MEVNKKMELLEDMLELDEGTLQAGDVLNEIEEWDSMALILRNCLLFRIF